MKKLNENVLRRLIMETIDEQSGVVTEGKKKKKLKEVDPVPEATAPVHQPEDTGMETGRDESEPQPKDFGLGLEFSEQEKQQAHETLDKAFEMAATTNPMLKDQYKGLLKSIEEMFSGKVKPKE